MAIKYRPPSVPRWYQYDWQHAVDIDRIPVLRPAALVISLMPVAVALVGDLSRLAPASLSLKIDVPLSLWVTWLAAVLFASAWLVLRTRSPRFLREYRDFGQYRRREHSHRWIVWEFFTNLRSFKTWRAIVQETAAKGLSEPHPPCGEPNCGPCEAFAAHDDDLVARPINSDRDICLPIRADGKAVVLWMREDDPKRAEKEKELFWVLYSHAAKDRLGWRCLYWTLVYLAAILFLFNVSKNIFLVVRSFRWSFLASLG